VGDPDTHRPIPFPSRGPRKEYIVPEIKGVRDVDVSGREQHLLMYKTTLAHPFPITKHADPCPVLTHPTVRVPLAPYSQVLAHPSLAAPLIGWNPHKRNQDWKVSSIIPPLLQTQESSRTNL
jgi:hypothetical protein